MSRSHAMRFRDKLMMRSIASSNGIDCPEFIGVFNPNDISEYLKEFRHRGSSNRERKFRRSVSENVIQKNRFGKFCKGLKTEIRGGIILQNIRSKDLSRAMFITLIP